MGIGDLFKKKQSEESLIPKPQKTTAVGEIKRAGSAFTGYVGRKYHERKEKSDLYKQYYQEEYKKGLVARAKKEGYAAGSTRQPGFFERVSQGSGKLKPSSYRKRSVSRHGGRKVVYVMPRRQLAPQRTRIVYVPQPVGYQSVQRPVRRVRRVRRVSRPDPYNFVPNMKFKW